MCGIAGIVARDGWSAERLAATAVGMATRMRHRGPDDAGVWTSPDGRVALAHRRLSIVDLSPAGHQPMASAAGRYVITFNGEIYNFQALRRDLQHEGATFRGGSDTEVLLAGIERWGIQTTLQRTVGMFAFAVWDSHERALVVARDRMGEKPVFVARLPWGLAFASEIRAFEALPDWRYDVDPTAVATLLKSGYVSEAVCIDRKVTRLRPATVWRLPMRALECRLEPPAPEPYWTLQAEMAATSVPETPAQAVDHLDALLRKSLEGQRVADVPLGAFLSGGVDSSVITGVLQSISTEPVRTFSIGFDDPEYDESGYARAVAQHLGCLHTEFRVSPADALAAIRRLPDVFDEPFADPSQVPTMLVSGLARQAVTVCLSGDGGDEIFGGYNRYFWSGRWGRRIASLPGPVRRAAAEAGDVVVRQLPDALLRAVVNRSVGSGATQNPRGKLDKALALLRLDSPVDRYSHLTRIIDPRRLLVPELGDDDHAEKLARLFERYGEVFGAMLWDVDDYLPGDQLVRVDRSSMAVSLEMRAPLLDHQVAAFGLAATRRFGDARLAARPKWLLKDVLDRYVPRALIDRPKMGFSIPLHRWLRVDLRDWVESLLDPASMTTGLFDGAAVARLWTEHLAGADHSRALWSVLMFQQWLEATRRRQMVGTP